MCPSDLIGPQKYIPYHCFSLHLGEHLVKSCKPVMPGRKISRVFIVSHTRAHFAFNPLRLNERKYGNRCENMGRPSCLPALFGIRGKGRGRVDAFVSKKKGSFQFDIGDSFVPSVPVFFFYQRSV